MNQFITSSQAAPNLNYLQNHHTPNFFPATKTPTLCKPQDIHLEIKHCQAYLKFKTSSMTKSQYLGDPVKPTKKKKKKKETKNSPKLHLHKPKSPIIQITKPHSIILTPRISEILNTYKNFFQQPN